MAFGWRNGEYLRTLRLVEQTERLYMATFESDELNRFRKRMFSLFETSGILLSNDWNDVPVYTLKEAKSTKNRDGLLLGYREYILHALQTKHGVHTTILQHIQAVNREQNTFSSLVGVCVHTYTMEANRRYALYVENETIVLEYEEKFRRYCIPY
jgi:hypothetical protein